MVLDDFTIGSLEKLKFTDVDIWVMKLMRKMIISVPQDRILDIEKFKEYCYEYFRLPMSTIERCLFKMFPHYDKRPIQTQKAQTS